MFYITYFRFGESYLPLMIRRISSSFFDKSKYQSWHIKCQSCHVNFTIDLRMNCLSVVGFATILLTRMMTMHCFVDSDHAGDKATRRSQTGILIFCNRAPVIAYSKRQNSVECSTYGSELVAMRQAVDLVKSLRYKLRMFGIPIEGPADIFCDNESVFKNVSRPESTLSKKQHSISYHACREAVASKIVRVAKEDTLTNLADLFTKTMNMPKREGLLGGFMYWPFKGPDA